MSLEAQLYPFPAERVIRHAQPGHRGDQVAVTHNARTVVYDSPEQLHAAVLAAYRHALAAEREQAVAAAVEADRRARRLREAERRRLVVAIVGWSVMAGCAAAVFAFAVFGA